MTSADDLQPNLLRATPPLPFTHKKLGSIDANSVQTWDFDNISSATSHPLLLEEQCKIIILFLVLLSIFPADDMFKLLYWVCAINSHPRTSTRNQNFDCHWQFRTLNCLLCLWSTSICLLLMVIFLFILIVILNRFNFFLPKSVSWEDKLITLTTFIFPKETTTLVQIRFDHE